MPNFDEISLSTAKIKLLPVSEKGRPPYCNCTRFWPLYSHLQVILHQPVNFRRNRTIRAKLWRHIDFLRWRP